MKSPTRKVIVAFGDSTTALRDGLQVWAQQLPVLLAESGIVAEVINAGVPGNTTTMARERFEHDVLAANPDLVVIQFGINDSAVDVWKDPPASASRTSLEQFRAKLTFFAATLAAKGVTVLFMTPNQIRWTDELKALYGKPPYDPENKLGMSTILADYAKNLRLVAEEQSVGLIDIFHYYDEFERELGRSCGELLLDGLHPNQRGQDLVARHLMLRLPSLLNL